MKYLNGWSYNRQGENSDTYAADKSTILEALQNKLGKENVFYTPGSDFGDFDDAEIEKAVEMAKKCFENNLCLEKRTIPKHLETSVIYSSMTHK
jgi:beta-glucosidase